MMGVDMSTMANLKIGSPFLGTWRNTDPRSPGIAEVKFAARDGGLALCLRGGRPIDQFEARAEIFVGDDGATAPEKIMAHHDLGSVDIVLHGWVKQGILVLAIFRKFTDGVGRSNYFDREFFYRADGPR
jgi:hypothetical protein